MQTQTHTQVRARRTDVQTYAVNPRNVQVVQPVQMPAPVSSGYVALVVDKSAALVIAGLVILCAVVVIVISRPAQPVQYGQPVQTDSSVALALVASNQNQVSDLRGQLATAEAQLQAAQTELAALRAQTQSQVGEVAAAQARAQQAAEHAAQLEAQLTEAKKGSFQRAGDYLFGQ